MDDRVRSGDHVVGLAEVREVGPDALAVGAAVVGQVDVEHVVAVVAQVADDPPAGLAAPARDDDPHPVTSVDGDRPVFKRVAAPSPDMVRRRPIRAAAVVSEDGAVQPIRRTTNGFSSGWRPL